MQLLIHRIVSSFLAQWIKVFTNTYNTKIQDADVEKKLFVQWKGLTYFFKKCVDFFSCFSKCFRKFKRNSFQ